MKKLLMSIALATTALSINTTECTLPTTTRIINKTTANIKIITNTNLSPSSVTTASVATIKAATGAVIQQDAECYVAAGRKIAISSPLAENVLRGKPADNANGWVITTVQGAADGKTYLQIAADSGLN